MVITHEPGASAEDVLIERYLEPHSDPRKAGYSWYRLKERGVPVWAIIGALMPNGANADAVAEDYGVSREAVEAAQSFYRQHREVIDARILLNTEA